MKYLILLAVVVVVIWLVRSARRPRQPEVAQPPSPVGVDEMVACAHCGIHLPRTEALPGQGGVFCGEAHRSAYERQRSH